MQEYPNNKKGNGIGGNKGYTFGTGKRSNHLYSITSLQDQKDSLNVVTILIQVFQYNIYSFLDRGASLSFVTPCVARNFDVTPGQLLMLLLSNLVNHSLFLHLLVNPF